MQFFRHFALAPSKSEKYAAGLFFDSRRELLEVGVAYAGIMLALWTSGAAQKFFIVIALLLVVICAGGQLAKPARVRIGWSGFVSRLG